MYSNKKIWSISYPIFLSLLAQNIINVTDTAFLGRVGEVELGASAMGGLYYICIFTIAFGFSVGSQIIIGRRNGEKNYKAIAPVVIQGVLFLFVLAVIFCFLSRRFGGEFMQFMISSDAVREATMDFLKIRVFGFFFSFFNVMFRAFYVGITKTKVLTFNAILMMTVNLIFAYILIFGKAGFPPMGIKGAAIASLIAEGASVLFFLIYTFVLVDLRKYGFTEFRSFNIRLLMQVLSISIYTMLQYFISMGTFFLFFAVVERLGQRELAMANIVRSLYIVALIPINSLSTATNSLVSNAMGAGKTIYVIPLIRKIATISFVIMLFVSLLMFLFPHAVLSIYTNDISLLNDAIPSLNIIAIAILISSVATIVFNGLSGTGNTRPALILEVFVLAIYCSGIYILGVKMHQPLHICFTIEIIYYSFLLIFCIFYFSLADWSKKKI